MKRQFVLLLTVVLYLMQLTPICTGRNVFNVFAGTRLRQEDTSFGREESLEAVENGGAFSHQTVSNYEKPVYRMKRLTAGAQGLSTAQKGKIIDLQNELRRGEGASNMHILKYNNKLAQLAQDWADSCNWGHRPTESYNAGDYGFDSVGESIWFLTGDVGKTIPEKPIHDWFDEKKGFVYNGNYCAAPPCGHYTALVWADTREVGCGLAKCRNLRNAGANEAFYFVCNYGPGGNVQDQLPYKKGAACSECSSGKFYCTRDLCDRSCKEAGSGDQCECKARCDHGSQTPGCKCRCDSGYSGVRCNERCVDKDPQCGANPGWPVSMCTDKTIFKGLLFDTVNEQCPKMCGRCK